MCAAGVITYERKGLQCPLQWSSYMHSTPYLTAPSLPMILLYAQYSLSNSPLYCSGSLLCTVLLMISNSPLPCNYLISSSTLTHMCYRLCMCPVLSGVVCSTTGCSAWSATPRGPQGVLPLRDLDSQQSVRQAQGCAPTCVTAWKGY